MKRLTLASLLLMAGLAGLFYDLRNPNSFVRAVTSGWAISGDNVYFTDGNVGIGTDSPTNPLEVQVNVSNLSSPTKIAEIYDGNGGFNRLSGARKIKTQGNYAYVISEGDDSFVILNISDPSNITIESEVYDGDGEFSHLDQLKDLVINGDYAYVASGEGITIIDISDPTNPNQLSTIVDSGSTYLASIESLTYGNNYLYASSFSEHAINRIDVTNPSSPSVKTALRDDIHGSYGYGYLHTPSDISYSENHLYILAENALTIVDVTTPTTPSKKTEVVNGIGGVVHFSSGSSIEASGNNVFVYAKDDSNGPRNIHLLDVTNKTSPNFVSKLVHGNGGFNNIDGTKELKFYENNLFVSSHNGDYSSVFVIDYSNTQNPQLMTTILNGSGGFNKLSGANNVSINGNYAFISSIYSNSITVIQIAQNKNPFTVNDSGKVGINTLTPFATLDVDGFMKLKVNSSAPVTCDATASGSIALSSSYTTCVCKSGTGWVKTADGSTSCSW